MIDTEILIKTEALLQGTGIGSSLEHGSIDPAKDVMPISADGSMRNFFRLKKDGKNLCVGVFPPTGEDGGKAEAKAAARIGRHLLCASVPVPEIIGWDKDSGLILFEDCGDIRLHDLLAAEKGRTPATVPGRVKDLYRQAVMQLCRMQVKGAEGFDVSWCYDTPYYDEEIMVKREACYFLRSCWGDLLGGEFVIGVEEEFADIALQAGKGLNNYFLHRDFQSRNIMVTKGEVKIIDFQGGRLGPPGYDLASLLIDPYSSLPENFKEDLMHLYLKELKTIIRFNEKDFRRQYKYLSLLRNMQILGAFSFLYTKRKKFFFKDYIVPALRELARAVSAEPFSQYTALKRIAGTAEKTAHVLL